MIIEIFFLIREIELLNSEIWNSLINEIGFLYLLSFGKNLSKLISEIKLLEYMKFSSLLIEFEICNEVNK